MASDGKGLLARLPDRMPELPILARLRQLQAYLAQALRTATARRDFIGSIWLADSFLPGGLKSGVLPMRERSSAGATFSYASRTSAATRCPGEPPSSTTPSQPRGPT